MAAAVAAAVSAGLLVPGVASAAPAFVLGPDGEAADPLANATTIVEGCPGDFNGDGNADSLVTLRLASAGATPYRAAVAFGDGTGRLGSYGDLGVATAGETTCAAANLDADAADELAVVGDSTAAVTLGDWNGAEVATDTVTAAGNGGDVASGDHDGDGDIDLVLALDRGDGIEGQLEVLVNDGTGAFSSAGSPDPTGGFRPDRLELGDFNNDNRVDAVVRNLDSSGGQGVTALVLAVAGGYGSVATLSGPTFSYDAGDVNDDGDLDLVYGAVRLEVLLGNGTGSLTPDSTGYPASLGPNYDGVQSVALADFDLDGDLDALTGDAFGGVEADTELFSFEGTGNATAPFFQTTSPDPISIDSTLSASVLSVAAADFDGDGAPDAIAGAAASSGKVAVVLNNTPLAPAVITPPGISGTATVGAALTCLPGRYSGRPQDPDPTYEWLRNGSPIAGETATTYTVREGDVGSTIACRETVTNPSGSVSATSASVEGGAVPAPPSNLSRPRVSGAADFGRTVACDAGSWAGGGDFAYSWTRAGQPIGGATSAGYEISRDDIGEAVACRVTVTNANGQASASSEAITAAGCVIPKLKGLRLGAARSALADAGCLAGRVAKKRKRGKPGRVLSSTPTAGAAVASDSPVAMVVSRRKPAKR